MIYLLVVIENVKNNNIFKNIEDLSFNNNLITEVKQEDEY